MKYFYTSTVAILIAATAVPALADEFFAVTPSGATEMLFAEAPGEAVGLLTSKCMDVKWTVISSSQTEVVCEAPMNFGQSLLGQLAMGNSYSTPPRRFFRFNLASVNGVSRVQASGWMELQMAFGQMKRTDFSGPEFHNSIINFLASAGGKLPVGTTFPNHVFLGMDGSVANRTTDGGFDVASVVPDGPAAKSGILVDDTIVKIAGKRIKSEANYMDAVAKAADSETFDVEVLRSGKSIKLKVPRVFRPVYNDATVAKMLVVNTAAAAPPIDTMSVADEIAKLAKLKADGILNEEEFQAQKSKLLAR
jgi:hypothetical protein